jgi:sugar phosphate isomerase/epimerase
MLRLCSAGWGFRELSVENYIQMATRLGIDSIELNCHTNVPLHLTLDMSHSEIMGIRRLASRYGTRIVAVAGGSDFTVEDETHLEGEKRKAKRTIEIASAVGAEVVRLFAGWIAEEHINEEKYQQVADTFNEIGRYAEVCGVSIGIENHGGITGTVAQMEKMFNMIESEAVGITYDPANFIASGENPELVFPTLQDRIVYVHLKDAAIKDGENYYCRIGEGLVNYRQILPRLLESYKGYLAIEYEDPTDVEDGTSHDLLEVRHLLTEIGHLL